MKAMSADWAANVTGNQSNSGCGGCGGGGGRGKKDGKLTLEDKLKAIDDDGLGKAQTARKKSELYKAHFVRGGQQLNKQLNGEIMIYKQCLKDKVARSAQFVAPNQARSLHKLAKVPTGHQEPLVKWLTKFERPGKDFDKDVAETTKSEAKTAIVEHVQFKNGIAMMFKDR